MIGKKLRKVLLITIGIMLGSVLVFSFAFFALYEDLPAKTILQAITGGVNKLEFYSGDLLEFDGIILEGSTEPYVISSVNNPSNTFTSTYNIYLDVKDNSFSYTTGEETGELLLRVFNPDGTEVTSITGLSYVTIGDISGFDITELNSTFPLINDYEITATGLAETRQDWRFEIEYLDLLNNQVMNNNQVFIADIVFQGDNEKEIFHESILEKNRGKDKIDLKIDPDYNDSVVPRSHYVTLSSEAKINYDYNSGLYPSTDNLGTSYYFRGAVTNNWVYFANMYWRIIRINGDNSIRMIYSGTNAPNESQSYNITGSNTVIGSSAYNSGSLNENLGYVFTETEQHGTTSSSTIKNYLENWYNNNLIDYSSYLADTTYCTDRTTYTSMVNNSIYTGTGIGSDSTYFGGAGRLVNIGSYTSYGEPSLLCSVEDSLAVTASEKNVSALTNPIGLISADEVVMAGLIPGMNNTYNYLYNNHDFYTMTPYSTGKVFMVNSAGQLSNQTFTTSEGVRPVINIKAGTIVTGAGHFNNPYVIEGGN